MEWRHVCTTNTDATNRAATNAARVVRASNSAGFPKEKLDGRDGRSKRNREVARQLVPGSGEAVEQVGAEGAAGVQRRLLVNGEQPKAVPAPEAGADVEKPLADNGLERGLDCGARSTGVRTANRRSRAAYNAYQREYMRKRRSGHKA
jgi:hypothetical protein